MAYIQYKDSVCASYSTEAACFANPADACGWDRAVLGGGCYLPVSALYDPEVLRGSLYCKGSLLDAAVGCALINPTAVSSGGGSGSVNCTSSSVAGADCVFLSAAQLEAGGLSTAALSYLRLVGLVSFTAQDADDLANTRIGGVCAARWLQKADTLAWLQRGVAANPEYGLLQPGLVGSCSGTEWPLVKALAAGAATCAAAAGDAAAGSGGGAAAGALDSYARQQQAACDSADGCVWSYASNSCEAGYFMLRKALSDLNDPWLRAMSAAVDYCDAAGGSSRVACEAAAAAAPPLGVDPTRMATLQFALSDPNWVMNGGSSGSRVGGGGASSWLMAICAAAAAAVLLLGGGGGGGGGT